MTAIDATVVVQPRAPVTSVPTSPATQTRPGFTRIARGAEVVAEAVSEIGARALRDHHRIRERPVRRAPDGDDLRLHGDARLAEHDHEVAGAVRLDRRIEEVRTGLREVAVHRDRAGRRRELRDPRARAEERVARRLAGGVRGEPQPSVLPDRLEHTVVVRVDPRLCRPAAVGGCDANGGVERRVIDGVAISTKLTGAGGIPLTAKRWTTRDDGSFTETTYSVEVGESDCTGAKLVKSASGPLRREVGLRRAAEQLLLVHDPELAADRGPPPSLQFGKMSAARTTIPSARPRRGWSAQPGAR